jgi:hypothetical protein
MVSEAGIAGLAPERELVRDPQCGIAGAGVAFPGLGSVGDEVPAGLEHAVQEVHVSEAPLRAAGRRTPAQSPPAGRRSSSSCPAAGRCLQRFQLGVVVRGPMCSMLRDPHRKDRTIWTAVVPDAVTVRTNATRRDYEPRRSAPSSTLLGRVWLLGSVMLSRYDPLWDGRGQAPAAGFHR